MGQVIMNNSLKNIIEALLLVSQEPLTVEKINAVLEGSKTDEIKSALTEISRELSGPDHGIQIIEMAGGYVITTKPEHDAWVRKLLQVERKNRLSTAALETLSVVAYHQPITQAEISAIRGVDSSYCLKTLLEKKLVKIVGRKKAPGSPLIYRTSEKFLQYFGINALEELPSEKEIEQILEEEKAVEG